MQVVFPQPLTQCLIVPRFRRRLQFAQTGQARLGTLQFAAQNVQLGVCFLALAARLPNLRLALLQRLLQLFTGLIDFQRPATQRVRRFALRVKGPSMGDVFPDGSIIICVKLMDIGRQPLDGEYVIVQRVRRDGLTEATVKQYVLKDGQVYLWPRSQHPDYQQPLKLTPDGEDEEVLITAIAIRVDRPL